MNNSELVDAFGFVLDCCPEFLFCAKIFSFDLALIELVSLLSSDIFDSVVSNGSVFLVLGVTSVDDFRFLIIRLRIN